MEQYLILVYVRGAWCHGGTFPMHSRCPIGARHRMLKLSSNLDANGSLLCLFQTQLRMPPTISIHLLLNAPRRQELVIRGWSGWFMWTIAVILMVVLSLDSGWWVQIRHIIMLCFAIYVASTLSPILTMKWSDGSYPSTIRVEPIMGKWWPPVGRRGVGHPWFLVPYPRKSQAGEKEIDEDCPNAPLSCFFLNPPSSTQGHGRYDWMSWGILRTGGCLSYPLLIPPFVLWKMDDIATSVDDVPIRHGGFP